jgi:hypothetical protein
LAAAGDGVRPQNAPDVLLTIEYIVAVGEPFAARMGF